MLGSDTYGSTTRQHPYYSACTTHNSRLCTIWAISVALDDKQWHTRPTNPVSPTHGSSDRGLDSATEFRKLREGTVREKHFCEYGG
ncbi:unnamed protein product [Citrullus colocynthis]|uniref:Uncharacterized protein n=1 Tax=Citrullus colocynthis TaxID=252529 RepID=A0ABP0Y533_9ROSI